MESYGLLSFLFSRPVPTRVEPDEVIPVHAWDDNPLFRRLGFYSLMVFNDVLDPEKLRSGLETLVSQRTWRKLGGRLRKKDNRYLEYHIPAEFTKDRPAIGFSHVDYSNTLKDNHPIASTLPKPSSRPTIVGDLDETSNLACGPGCPTCIDDYLYPDYPMLGLHVVSFKDATLVTLQWLHLVSDAMGMKSLLDGWIGAMQGREISEQQGYDYDPLVDLGKYPTEPYSLSDKRMGAASLLAYGLRNGYGLALGKKQGRMVCIPGWFLKKLRTTALQELTNAGVKNPFLSENDILVAWWSRMALSHLPPDSTRPVAIQFAMSLRKTLQKDLLDPDKPYVSNCTTMANMLLSAKDFKKKPTSDIALQVRIALNEQRTREQVEAYQALMLE